MKSTILVASALSLCFAAPAGAQLAAPATRFQEMDTDRNGEISAEEIANAATSLKVLDKNTDGVITEDEVQPAGRGRG